MKKICLVLAICCLFASCPDTPENNGDDNIIINPGRIRAPDFSQASGLYSQSFSLSITAGEGNSIYYSIDGSIPDPKKVNNKTVFKYSSPVTITDRNSPMQANLLATPENSHNFYMFKTPWDAIDDPRGSMPDIYTPTSAQVPKAAVIRAVAVDPSGTKSSDVTTRTYFVGNNLGNYMDVPIISLVTDPYNLVDINYGIMVRGVSTNRWEEKDSPTKTQYNFLQRGIEWERVAFMEYFTGNASSRSSAISTNVGIRIRGGWSRAAGQKSFNIYFRSEYGGINNLTNYQLIPGAVRVNGTPVGTYKSFMLRNGANDSEATKFYDVFLHEMLNDRNFSTQAGIPCVLFINGEYWGPYNLQERYSDNHTEYKYGVNRNNVISFDNGALDDGNPGEDSLYWSMISNFKNKDMSNAQNYADFCKIFDIQNFIDYFAAQIYIHNEDWPQNNYRLWRTRAVESGNPYGDTKWRWQMFDVEFSMGIYSSGGLLGSADDKRDAFYRIIQGDHSYHDNSKLFAALMKNSDFKRDFVNAIMDLYNINFHPNRFEPKLNDYAAIYSVLMGDYSKGYFARWGGWPAQFDNKVNDARKYLNDIRPVMINEYLPKYFGVNAVDLKNIVISARDDSYYLPSAEIKLNSSTLRLSGSSWDLKYYSGNPITVTANAAAGYQFTHWTVTGEGSAVNPNSAATVINFSGDVQITANYARNSSIDISGTLTLSGLVANAGYAKLILHNANSTWKREIGLNITGGKASWTTKIVPFAASTPIYFRVETYQNSDSPAPLYVINNAKTIDVYNSSVTGVSIEAAPQPLKLIWGSYVNSPAAMTREDLGNGEYRAYVTATSVNQWDAAMTFDYASEAMAGIKYKYSFYAKTASGTRNMYIQYYWTDAHGSLGQNITITNEYQLFTIPGAALPTANGSTLSFQCANQTGTFYIKDVTIIPE